MKKAPAPKSRFRIPGPISDTISELKRVVWPTRQETTRLTIMVLIVCAVLGVILGALDYGFNELVTGVLLP